MPMIPAPSEQSVLPEGQLAYQNVQSTPDSMGGSIGRAAQKVGNDADQIAMRNFAIKNEGDRVNAENELMARTQDLQNGNKDKGIAGYRTLVGQNAVDSLSDYQQKVQDAYKEVRSGLNPAVQRMFDQTAFRIVRGTTDSMGSYSSQQQVVGLHQSARAQVDLARNAALTYADEPGGWDAHISKLQEASMFGSRTLGLGTDAMEEQRQRDVSMAYVERTKQLMVRNPMEAHDFYYGTASKPGNIGSILPDQRWELEQKIKSTTATHYADSDGLDAYHAGIAKTSAPALPRQIEGSSDKAYDQATLDSRAKFINSPTKWDAEIDAAAKANRVSPTEIKLKIAMESMGNPNAVNPDGGHGDHATGLGQFTADTAKRYGVTDRNDPVQSINGIARMLASNGGTVGGDMEKSDRAYFGGNVNAKGPKTDQYTENARALRQYANGGSGAPAPMGAAELEGREGSILQAADAKAEARNPGDAVYREQVRASAHRNFALDLQALKGKDYADMSSVLDATVKGNATGLSDLPPLLQQTYASLTPQNREGVDRQFDHNMRAARGEFTQSDPKLVNQLTQNIYRNQGDPQKITQPGQLTEYMGKGLNYTDLQRLTKEIGTANTPEGSPFLKQVNGVKETGRKMLMTAMNSQTLAHPEFAEEAAYRFGLDVDKKIAAARTAKTDPQSLFQPGSKDYVLDPSRVSSFMPTEAQIAARKAGPTQSSSPLRVANDADYNALPSGSTFTAPDGSVRRKP